MAHHKHKITLRHVEKFAVSVSVMFGGCSIAIYAKEWHFLPHIAWDCLGYLIHGIGAIPFAQATEPLWSKFVHESEG